MTLEENLTLQVKTLENMAMIHEKIIEIKNREIENLNKIIKIQEKMIEMRK